MKYKFRINPHGLKFKIEKSFFGLIWEPLTKEITGNGGEIVKVPIIFESKEEASKKLAELR